MKPTASPSPPYIERFGFTPKTMLVLLVAAVFCPASFLPGISVAIRVLTLVLFGGGGLVLLAAAIGRGIALRVDHQGVTIGAPPTPWPRRTRVVLVPWRDLRQVVLFSQAVPRAPRMPYIALALRPGAAPPAGIRLRGPLLRLSSSLVPHVPPEVLPLSRPINGWRLDRARLLAAVAAYAPEVGVVEVEQDGSMHPVTV